MVELRRGVPPEVILVPAGGGEAAPPALPLPIGPDPDSVDSATPILWQQPDYKMVINRR